MIAAQNILLAGLAAFARGGASGSGETETPLTASACFVGVLRKGIPVLLAREDVQPIQLAFNQKRKVMLSSTRAVRKDERPRWTMGLAEGL